MQNTPVFSVLLRRETGGNLSKGSHLQKWPVGSAQCTDSSTIASHLFLHLLIIKGFQEAGSTFGLIDLSTLTRSGPDRVWLQIAPALIRAQLELRTCLGIMGGASLERWFCAFQSVIPLEQMGC